MAKALTAKAVEAAKPKATRYEIPDARIAGLFLVVQPSGGKSWAWRYRLAGKPKKLTIGPILADRSEERVPHIGDAHTLAEARAAAENAARVLAEGGDPAALKRADVQASREGTDTVDHALEEYLRLHVEKKNRANTIASVKSFLALHVRPAWTGKKLKAIAAKDVRDLMRKVEDPVEKNGRMRGGPVAAKRGHAVLSRFFAWCVTEGKIPASPVISTAAPSSPEARDRILTDDEVSLVWRAADRIGAPFGPMLRLLLLTGQRREEVAAMRWAEIEGIHGPAPLWVIPASRSKNGKPHAVPLAPEAAAILQALPRVTDPNTGKESQFVFTTTGETPVSGYSKAKARLDHEIAELVGDEADPIPAWRLHDLRRTVASGMARLAQPVHVVEAVLNHRSGAISGVAAVYIRHEFADEKRAALSAWARAVMALVEPKENNVIELAGAR
ncbi:tyrosine-type recombinase/integrase [Paracoccus fontiphilus]|uniref:Tyrosine-type recombinase/integrase n=1 Tax=Paracoccus fontiphilus TaxID=1815556 RepID=A0ABV7I9M0_9RHOB|nr:site-specific integrase [Paracoccus fontiphilus]